MVKLLTLLLLLTSAASAQNLHYHTISNTLLDQPQLLQKAGIKKVNVIFRDSRQLTWIGTQMGLYRFDGINLVFVNHIPEDPHSLPDNTISSIIEDRTGNIWIGTLGGVAQVNPYNLKCKIYRDSLHNFSGDFDNKLIIDSYGRIWAGNSMGLQQFVPSEDKFKTVWCDQIPFKPASAYITSISICGKDSIVLGTFSNIVVFNSKNYSATRIIPIKNIDLTITSLLVDYKKRVWVGTWDRGFLITDFSFKEFKRFTWQENSSMIPTNVVFGLKETDFNNIHLIWVNLGKGLLKITEDSLSFTTPFVPQYFTLKDVLAISCIYSDSEGFIWVGNTSGINRFTAEQNLFSSFPVKLNGYVESISTFQLDGQQFFGICAWHGKQGLTVINKSSGKVTYYKGLPGSSRDQSNISDIAADKYNRLWISSLGGLYVFDKKMKLLYDFSKDADSASRLISSKTNGVYIFNDTVWVCNYKKGVSLYNLQFKKIQTFLKGENGLKDDLIWRMLKGKNGSLWVCGDGFLYKYEPANNYFKQYDFNSDKTKYLPTDITELPDGTLMIATQTGLIEFHPSDESFKKITNSYLQKEIGIVSICSGFNNDVWYVTSEHLVHYYPSSSQFIVFGAEDGLDVKEDLQFIRKYDQKSFLLAQWNNFVLFNPELWKKRILPPLLFLHSIQINDSSVSWSKPVTQLDLDYFQNKIYIEFDGISYYKPEQNKYSFKMDGVDKDWNSSDKNFVSYANLLPGNYQLHVKVANYAGQTSKEYKLNIFIKAPYWTRWWFIGIMILAVGTIFFFFIKYITQRNLRERILLLEKEQAVEKERNRIANDMHDDLGSGLTKIAILSEVAKAQLHETETVSKQLEKISWSSRELVDNLQDIIWVLNPKNDSLENLATYIREYALKFFESMNKSIHFDFPDNLPKYKLSEEKRRNTFLVVKETLNNIAKHSYCNSITIRFHVFENNLQIIIKDNGRGFNPAKIRTFANGLRNMNNRMEQIGGYFDIYSGEKNGTTSTITTPL